MFECVRVYTYDCVCMLICNCFAHEYPRIGKKIVVHLVTELARFDIYAKFERMTTKASFIHSFQVHNLIDCYVRTCEIQISFIYCKSTLNNFFYVKIQNHLLCLYKNRLTRNHVLPHFLILLHQLQKSPKYSVTRMSDSRI